MLSSRRRAMRLAKLSFELTGVELSTSLAAIPWKFSARNKSSLSKNKVQLGFAGVSSEGCEPAAVGAYRCFVTYFASYNLPAVARRRTDRGHGSEINKFHSKKKKSPIRLLEDF